ncbi:hypothetical protein [uncultured Desulfovibrio sp.]|uniref:hypothetical protein n=1 Tax=uncultured Desulfovibrio sp. TaxID=167968 RepID=UPI0026035FF6|nr:hypothetical protein [uncultured Desulfovibrio sp.]
MKIRQMPCWPRKRTSALNKRKNHAFFREMTAANRLKISIFNQEMLQKKDTCTNFIRTWMQMRIKTIHPCCRAEFKIIFIFNILPTLSGIGTRLAIAKGKSVRKNGQHIQYPPTGG